MATYESNYTEAASTGPYQVKRIYWGAILAGALVMLVVVMLLNLLGIGIGLTTINPQTEAQPFSGLGTGALIWWVASNLIAIFIGGFLAGKMAGIPRNFNAIAHGLLSWCLFTLVSAWLLTTTVGSVLSGVGSVVSQSISTLANTMNVNVPAGGGAGQGTDAINISNMTQDMNTTFAVGPEGKGEVSAYEVRSVVSDAFFSNGKLKENVSQQEVYNAVQENTDLNQQQARDLSSSLMNRYETAQTQLQQLQQTSAAVADNAGTAAIWSFVALLIGAIVAAVAGMVGKPKGLLQPVTVSHNR